MSEQGKTFRIIGDIVKLEGDLLTINLPFDKEARIAFMELLKNTEKNMGLPQNTELPYFEYGLFKPGELAYNEIKEFVDEQPQKKAINGSLLVRDGLPLLKLGTGGTVIGYLINFRKSDSTRAYDKIAQFEPKEQYKWDKYELPNNGSANLLIGRSPEKGSVSYDKDEWKAQEDPVFKEAMLLVTEIVNNYAIKEFKSAEPELFDWKRLFQLQMAYLLLWSAIERFCSLAYGPGIDPGKKLKPLSGEHAFKDALKHVVKRIDTVYDSRYPEKPYKLNADNSYSSVKYYYRVRSNLTHRGKGARRDGEIVRKSFIELAEIFQKLLVAKGLSSAQDDKAHCQ